MRSGITPSFPFQVDTQDSDYLLLQTTPELVRQNLKNLILTSPGERIMDPQFGAGIRRFLFQNRTDATTSTIRGVILSQIKRYMPFVSVEAVEFSTDEENENYLGIAIKYFISASKTSDTLIININLNSSSLLRT